MFYTKIYFQILDLTPIFVKNHIMSSTNINIPKEDLKAIILELIQEGKLPYSEIVKDIISEKRLYYKVSNKPLDSTSYKLSKDKFIALQEVFKEDADTETDEYFISRTIAH